MTTSEQLEREAERTRSQIAGTLDELRSRLTPGRMIDEALDYVRNGTGQQFITTLGRQIIRNPIPITLAAVGITWLMMARNHSEAEEDIESEEPFASVDTTTAADRLTRAGKTVQRSAASVVARGREKASELSERTKGLVQEARDAAADKIEKVSDQAQSGGYEMGERMSTARSRLRAVADAASETAEEAYGQTRTAYRKAMAGARDTASTIGQSASAVTSSVTHGGRTLAAYLRDEPLMLAGVGLALGALIGAILPRTRIEEELMGEASEKVKEAAAATIKEPLEKGKALAEQGLGAIKEEATRATEPSHDVPLVPSDSEETETTKIR